jgi:hypothetical protein
MVLVPDRDNKIRGPGVIIKNVPFRSVACWEGDCISVFVQPSFEVGYFVGEGKGSQCVLLLSFVDGGGKALGNVKDGGRVVLVELHHIFGRAGEDGLRRSRGGPYGG